LPILARTFGLTSLSALSSNLKKIEFVGTGAMVAAVTTASRRDPFILGKPNRFMFETVQKDHPSINPDRTLMIGDNTKTDILFGKNCGLKTLMVGTGVDSLEQVLQWKSATSDNSPKAVETKKMIPDYFANSLGDLLPLANALK
jgi:ribonucleotide monophosphatase NagD (HAD superfamily)